jgi:hypothetical protein
VQTGLDAGRQKNRLKYLHVLFSIRNAAAQQEFTFRSCAVKETTSHKMGKKTKN